MPRFSLAIFALVCLFSPALIAADGEPAVETERPTSPAAVSALGDYDRAVELADDAWKKSRLAADHKLVEKLKIALTVATRAGNLKEANLIDQRIKAATARIEVESVPSVPALKGGNGISIKRAFWFPKGDEKKGVDVTENVVKATHGTTIEKIEGLPDLVFGVHKVLIIDATYAGLGITIQISEGGPNAMRLVITQPKGR